MLHFLLHSASSPILIFPQVIFATGQKWVQKEGKCENGKAKVNNPVKHKFSCELSRPLQSWILSAHDPDILVSNVDDMDKQLVHDVKSSSAVVRPRVTGVFCGWVCHSVLLSCSQALCQTWHEQSCTLNCVNDFNTEIFHFIYFILQVRTISKAMQLVPDVHALATVYSWLAPLCLPESMLWNVG